MNNVIVVQPLRKLKNYDLYNINKFNNKFNKFNKSNMSGISITIDIFIIPIFFFFLSYSVFVKIVN